MNIDHPNKKMTAQKTKALPILGCIGTIILGVLVILLSVWIIFIYASTPTETLIMTSESPNKKNSIEFFRIEEFPAPTLKIKYDNRYIIQMNILPSPDKITVEWESDKEAHVILEKGNMTDIEEIQFK